MRAGGIESIDDATKVASPVVVNHRRGIGAIAVSAAFVAILAFNLCYPTPRGPGDNGDFIRVFPPFSSGPVGLPKFPEPSDPAYYERFFRHFVRFWHLDPPYTPAQETTSSLVHLPERYLRLTPHSGTYDQTRNALYLALLLGAALLMTLRRLRSGIARATVSAAALLMADAQMSMYIASFYQEAGAYVFTLLLVFAMHLLWERSRPVYLVAFTLTAILLALTKFPFSPSVLLVGSTVLITWGLAGWQGRWRRIEALVALVVLVAVSVGYFDLVRDRYGKDVSYNFIFAGAVATLRPAERGPFLGSIGIDPGFASLSGKCFYDGDSRGQEPSLHGLLGNAKHLQAIRRLALDYPAAFLRLLGTSFEHSGLYDIQLGTGLGIEPIGVKRPPFASIEPWAWLRRQVFGGGWAYAVILALTLGLLTHVWLARARDWRLLYATTAMACWAASVLQVGIAILGNGTMDLNKHLWFGNVLLDLALIFALAGLGFALYTRTARAAASEEAQS